MLGFPKHMNNDIGERAQQSMEFGEMLKRRTGLEVILWDERLDDRRGRTYSDREQRAP